MNIIASVVSVGSLGVWLLFVYPQAVSAQSPDAVMNGLRAGVRKWREDVRFKCNYTCEGGVSTTLEKALSGEYDHPDWDVNGARPSRGLLVKDGRLLRASEDYYGREDPVVDASGRPTLTGAPFEILRLGRIVMEKRGPVKGQVAVVRVEQRPAPEADRLDANPYDLGVDPFEFGGGVDGDPFLQGMPRPDLEEELVDQQVLNDGPDYVTVTLVRAREGKSRCETRLRFWTAVSPPVLTRAEQFSEDLVRGLRSVVITEGSDFVQCDGGTLASSLVHVGGPVTLLPSRSPAFLARVWKAEGLGARQPSGDDNVLHLAGGTAIRGLRNVPSEVSLNHLDIRKLKAEHILGQEIDPGPLVVPDDASHSGRWFWAALLFSAVGIAVLLVVVGRRRQRR